MPTTPTQPPTPLHIRSQTSSHTAFQSMRRAPPSVDRLHRPDRSFRQAFETLAFKSIHRQRLAGIRPTHPTHTRLTDGPPNPTQTRCIDRGTIPAEASPRRRGGAAAPAPRCSRWPCSCFRQAARRHRRTPPSLPILLLFLLLGTAASLGMASVDPAASGAGSSGSKGDSGVPRRRTLRLLIDTDADGAGGGSGSGSGGLRRLSVQAATLVRTYIGEGVDRC